MDGGVVQMIPCVSLAGTVTEIIFCWDKTRLLSRQKYACRDKHNFVSLLLSRQTRVCRDKTRLLSRQKYAYRDKHNFVSLLLSRQTRVCRDKTRLFFATKVCLSRQNFFFCKLTFV